MNDANQRSERKLTQSISSHEKMFDQKKKLPSNPVTSGNVMFRLTFIDNYGSVILAVNSQRIMKQLFPPVFSLYIRDNTAIFLFISDNLS